MKSPKYSEVTEQCYYPPVPTDHLIEKTGAPTKQSQPPLTSWGRPSSPPPRSAVTQVEPKRQGSSCQVTQEKLMKESVIDVNTGMPQHIQEHPNTCPDTFLEVLQKGFSKKAIR
jgi:hypothetical protein